ncbi:receptor-type tyrosine-protein phosphatase eta-like isoform X10 [Colossoma macropomum]|uniref:receptor-type tyrosine-protein phosphatase eta-like isoform X10 n=1 Tax=Colossoma macropomum TaxID=42526 RepID=UPI0018653EAB|nr:receptor-type tyrosine-protein phosphatase eta-like isoform X10 [Colossoma macropomum]
MRRYSFRWTVHGALLGLCVLLQSFSTTVPQSTVSTSAGQTSSGTSSTNSPAASTQGNIITTSAREETSSSTDSPTTSVTIEKTSTQGSGNTTTQNVMNGTVLSSPATSAREETSSSTDSPTTSVTIEKTSTQGSGNTNLNIINLRVTDRNTSSVSLAWNLLQANSDTGTQTNGIVSTSATTTVNNLTDGGNHTSTVTAVTADGSTTGLPVQTSAVTNSEKTKSLQPGYYKVEWTNETVSTTANTSNMSYTVTSLTAGMNYTFIVTAVAADGVTVGAPAQTSAFTKPDVVTNLNVSSRSTSSVSLTWNPPQGMNSYTVEWTDVNGSNKVNVSNTTYTVTNLTAGGKYTFIVTAVAADGVTAGAPTQISAFTNPDVVTNLNISDTSTSSVSLTWDPPQGNSSSYRIKWANGSVNVSNTSYTVTSLTAGVNYTFSVTTVAADGITSGASVQTSAFTKPDIVTNLTSNSTTTSVTLTWNLRQGGSSFYTVAWTSDVLHNVNTPDTSYTVTGLTAGVNYTFTVTAVAADNVTAGSPVQISAFTKPGTVTNLTVSDRSTSSVSLTWNLPQGNNSSYTVEWTDVNGSNKVNVSNTTYTVTNLTAGGKYTFIVTAVAADGVTAGAPTQISAFTKPDIVTNLTSNSTTTSVTLTWNLRQGGSSFYTVAWTSDVPYNRNTPDTSYTVTGLTAGVNYTFTVTAVAADNVTAGSPVQISAFTKPGAVTNLTVSDRSTSSVSLTWNLPQGNSSSYTVEWTDVNGSNKVNVSNTTYTVTNLTAGGKYTFIVTAVAADGVTAGAPTQISAFTKPDAVTNLTISDSNTSSVSLTWNSPQGNSSFYRVGWTDGNMYINATTSNTSYTVTNLTPGVNYTFSVTAVAGDGVTAGALVQTSTFTNPDVVSNLNVSDKNTSSVFLIWILQHGNSFFFRVEWTGGSATTSLTSYMATNLTAGMNYTFSVTAVAADGKTTGATTQISTFTRPEIIRNLNAFQISTRNVSLNWTAPTGKSAFFRVLGLNESVIFNKTTKVTSFDITDLTPGLNFTFHVSAIAADNFTEGGVASLSVCTDASPVLTYSCEGPNHTDASLNITWMKPPGFCHGFNLSGTYISQNTCNRDCHHIISNLQYGMPYNVTITTLACGQSGIQNFVCTTGFTDPPVPTKPADLIFSPGSNQKRTVVQFSGSLLNGSKGEITAYGVLLSTDFDSNPNRTDLKNTYTDWTQKKSKSYLTVLKLNEKSMDRTEMIQIEIGTDETIQGTNYTNAPLEPNRYRVAVVLFTYLHISDGIVDTSLSFVSITPFATATIDIPNPLNIVGIVLGVLFFIIIILIIVIIVFIKLKRQRKKNDTGIPITTIRTKISIPVKVVDYEVYFKKQQADSNCGFAEEYEDLKVVGTAQNKSSALALENKGKNRYNNVLPYDSSRVKLSTHGSPFDDYINANYIAGYNSKKEYIAAQGPLPATVNEFWRMIWEKHVQTIVMLTKCNEQGRVKCEKYWPSGTKTYSNITVTNISEIALEDWTISDFTIRNVKTAESREVRHFHFTAWPDHGVPETTEVLINFRHLVREHMDQYSRHSPSVVHCSAGVGRTGTFIALDHLIFQIERESMVDIFGIVYDMRMHRPLMVQTEDQYVFLNQCAVDIIKSRMGTNVDLIYQNAAAFNVYGNVDQRWH